MLKCVLLDQMTDGWQAVFSSEVGVDALLYRSATDGL